MLQHDGISPVDCVYMDRPRPTVYLQVLVGESWALWHVVYPISSSFGLLFLVYSPRATCYFALQICPYNAIKFLPRQQQITGNPRRALKQPLGMNFKKHTVYIAFSHRCVFIPDSKRMARLNILIKYNILLKQHIEPFVYSHIWKHWFFDLPLKNSWSKWRPFT